MTNAIKNIENTKMSYIYYELPFVKIKLILAYFYKVLLITQIVYFKSRCLGIN